MKKRKMFSLGVAISGVICAAMLGACSQNGETADTSDENAATGSFAADENRGEESQSEKDSTEILTESETETSSQNIHVLGSAVSDVNVEIGRAHV